MITDARAEPAVAATDRAPDFEVFVPGVPRPQGSKTRNGNGSMRESSRYVKRWREAIALLAATDWRLKHGAIGGMGAAPQIDGPLMLGVVFLFPRPKAHFRKCPSVHMTVGYAKQCTNCRGSWRALKPNAPVYMAGKPDKDKLVRAVGDALVTAGVVKDDSLFVRDHDSGCKRYANPGEQPGAWIRIWRVT
jgi:Holliday junction resolvase RusA-like endonuclease